MTGHAYLAPSSASIWGPGGCPAHPRMAAEYPDNEDNEAAREGTAAHEYIATIVTTGEILETASNGHPITDEIVECAQQMIDDITHLAAREGVEWRVEQRLDMPDTQNWGTSDFIAIDREARRIWVWDYKHGHKNVDAFENWQLVNYATGAERFFDIVLSRDEWTFDLRIYQPRSYHGDGPCKKWVVSRKMLSMSKAALFNAAGEALEPDAPMRTGNHCEYCSARHVCPALQQVAAGAMDISLRGLPNELSAADAGTALRMVDAASERLEALQTGLAAQVEAAIREGQTVPGWSLKQGHGREVWTLPEADIFAMGDAMGVDVRKPPQPITPIQAVKKGFDENVKKQYSNKPRGAMKLTAVDSKDVRKAFTTKGNDNE